MSYAVYYRQAGKKADELQGGYEALQAERNRREKSRGLVSKPKLLGLDSTKHLKKNSRGGSGGFAEGFSKAFSSGMSADGNKPKDTFAEEVEEKNGEDRFGGVMAMAMGALRGDSENPVINKDVITNMLEPEQVEELEAHLKDGGTVMEWLKYQNQNATRNKPLSEKLVSSMSFLADMDVQMVVYSGGQDALGEGTRRTGSTRHDNGNAADVFFVDKKTGKVLDWSKPEDQPIFEEIFYRAYQKGVVGWGAHTDYMGNTNVHLGFGAEATWGKGGTGNAAPWLENAHRQARAGNIPEQFKKDARRTASLMERNTSSTSPASNAPASIIQTESSGRWDASNDAAGAGGKGHFGRVQFSRARLEEAKKAGAIPADMTPEQFLKDKDAQVSAENWHFADIENFIKRTGLDKYIGQKIKGIPITMQGMIAVAHLGGQTGLRRFITSGGTYNPKDAYGTHLSDYLERHMA